MITSRLSLAVLGAALVSQFGAATAKGVEDRSLQLAEENYLCTNTGSVRIDSGFTGDVSVSNTTNIYHGGNAKSILVVDRPGGSGSVPEDAEAGELRSYLAKTRRLSTMLPLVPAHDQSALAYKPWGPGPAGSVMVVRKHDDGEVTYRERMDFGGGAGRFIAYDHYGECSRINAESELPQTIAMAKGLTGDEAEEYIDEWEAEIEALAKQQREEIDNADSKPE